MSRDRGPMALDRAMMMSLNAVAAVAVVLALGGLALAGWRVAMGIASGGLLAAINLWLLGQVTRSVLGGKRGRLYGVLGGLKFLGLLGIAYLLLEAGLTSGLTLAVGYTSLPIGITIGALLGRS